MNKQYQLNDIKFSYTNKLILNIQKQHFEKGKITTLIGENGAGKSTLLGLLSFILPVQSGAMEFSGKRVNKNELFTLRKSVGLVQQNPYLIKGSVIRNIGLGLKFRGADPVERKTKVRNMLRLLRIEDLAERSVQSLSGGEAQKVAIGRALVLDPEVILFDEPFTYLDQEFVEEFETLITQLRDEHNKTIIFTTHNKLQARTLSDYVFHLKDGVLIEILSDCVI